MYVSLSRLNVGSSYVSNPANATNSDISFDLSLRGKRLPVDANNALTVSQSTLVTVRSKDRDDWSAPVRRSFLVGVAPATKGNLVVSQIMYRPPDATAEEEAAGFFPSKI